MNARTLPMCSPHWRFGLVLLAGLLAAAGCQPLNDKRDVKLDRGEARSVLFSAPRYDQKVTVEAHSPGNPVSVYLVKDSEREKTELLLTNRQTPKDALASKANAEEISLTATVPAGTEFAVVLCNQGKGETTVKLKVTGR
jgi:hypothetical protein